MERLWGGGTYLGNAGGNHTHTDLGDELHADHSHWVGGLQIVDKLEGKKTVLSIMYIMGVGRTTVLL